jgi:pimeloyl-ACP methyl ester carboxylesterase
MHYATTSDGVRIAYMSLGDGLPIVFASNIFGDLAGYRVGWPHMREVTDRLVKLGWRVIRYDVRGMGYSDRGVADVGLAGRVLDLEAVVAQLGIEQFAVGGLDIGAATAMAYAVANPAAIPNPARALPTSSSRPATTACRSSAASTSSTTTSPAPASSSSAAPTPRSSWAGGIRPCPRHPTRAKISS